MALFWGWCKLTDSWKQPTMKKNLVMLLCLKKCAAQPSTLNSNKSYDELICPGFKNHFIHDIIVADQLRHVLNVITYLASNHFY